MPVDGPFHLAWVDEDDTTFGPEHVRTDEYVFSSRRVLAEGEKPMLELEIENPREGLLSPDRKQWAWVSYGTATEVVPLFFGRVVATPMQIFEEVITVQLVADPADYKHRVQRVIEPLKVLPWYDQVFVDVTKRDDPEAVLETRAMLLNVDHVTHEVTAVGITEGPDGNVTISADDHFYKGMNSTLTTPPARSIKMDATVSWVQTSQGIVDLGSHSVTSFSDSILSEWPKPLTSLGGGWTVNFSDAVDSLGTRDATTVHFQNSWTNKEKKHNDGDTMSVNESWTSVVGPVGASQMLTYASQTGFLDPFATDGNGDPSPVNIPATASATWASVCTWRISTTLVLEYRAERQRTERVIFTISADTQEVRGHPTVTEESEVITLQGADVGAPIVNLLNWTTVSGTHVDVGQVIFPDDPQTPGGQSIQIAVVAGTAGTEPPDFSDIPGVTVVDGGVTWSSLGQASPSANSRDWTADTHANAGDIILPKRPFYQRYSLMVLAARRIFPPKPMPVSEGAIIQVSNGSFQVCTVSGVLSLTEPAFSATWGATTTSITSTWRSLGMSLPSGSTFQVCTTAGVTGPRYMIPPFGETLHDTTADGAAVWTCIGSGEIPVGGVPGNTPSPSYFTRDRGLQSVEHLALRVRSKLLYRARCVQVEFDVDYATGIDITPRNTVTLEEPRVAGGLATGKVISAVLVASDAEFVCRVTIACLVGKDNAVVAIPGDPDYVDDDYVEDNYQRHEGHYQLLASGSDVSFAPPTYVVTDDGLSFPLDYGQVVVENSVLSTGSQSGAVEDAISSMAAAANIVQGGSANQQVAAQRNIAMLNSNSVSNAVANNPIWIQYQIKPVSTGPFNSAYVIRFSELTIASGIDLTSGVAST